MSENLSSFKRLAWVRFWLLVLLVCPCLDAGVANDAIPKPIRSLLRNFCADCHDGPGSEADLSLTEPSVAWNESSLDRWEHVHELVERGVMPPPDSEQMNAKQQAKLLEWIDSKLVDHGPIGGTPLRRLSQREYSNTIETVFGLKNFELPGTFPPDDTLHGFDNHGAGLILSGSHLEALSQTAAQVADEFFPPPKAATDPVQRSIPPEELVISYSSACLIDGAMRLASSGSNPIRNATWLSKFEASVSGVYEVTLKLSCKLPPNSKTEPPIFRMSSMSANGRGEEVELKEFELKPGEPQEFYAEVKLNRGDTLAFRYVNGPLDYDSKPSTLEFFKRAFFDDRKLAAAWIAVGDPARGGNGWLRVKEELAKPNLDVDSLTDAMIENGALEASRNNVSTGETIVYKYFEEGPNIGVHHVHINGPTKTIRDRDDVRRDQLRERLLGDFSGKSDQESMRVFFAGFLRTLFRREVTNAETDGYVDMVIAETERCEPQTSPTEAFDRGMHLAIRTALMSPSFLFRGTSESEDLMLATRLAYFLTSRPPDEKLLGLAIRGKLSDSKVLRTVTKGLLKKNSREFVADFSSQWLGTWKVDQLMPDARLVARFDQRNRGPMQQEVRDTFAHILQENLPVTDFIAPNFLFTDPTVGWEIYQLPQFKPVKKKARAAAGKGVRLVEVPRDGHHGGLLGMSAVMMATANGVDTQPVLRGVWVLENILGSPPPEPPDSVPALTPDTSQATTVKEKLAAHMSEASCATCHREIDPMGFVLENFDPIGRWRNHYPVIKENESGKTKTLDGQVVDASGVLPDGTKITNVVDLKKWMVENPKPFANCLSEKLLTYATGRSLSYREKKLLEKIVAREVENGLRFQDLVLALVDSNIFRSR